MSIVPPWNIERVRTRLTTRHIGWPLLFHDTITSTNTAALELARHGAAAGTLVLAEEQTGGRGRHHRAWVSARGTGIWMSLILKALDHDPRHVLISMLCALSVVDTVGKLTGVSAQVKWPNDIWIEGRKVCGILIEAGPAGRMVVAGLGINLYQEERDFPAELRDTAVSLYQASGRVVDREQFLMELLYRFEAQYLAASPATHDLIVEQYRSRSALIGREVTVNGAMRGRVRDVSRAGELVVETAQGVVALVDGQVRLAESK